MEAREHFEAAAQALAAAETPGIAPALRDEHLESMRDHRSLARLAADLDWNERQKASEAVPTVPDAPNATVPAVQPAPMAPWTWAANRRELLRELGKLFLAAVLVGGGIFIGVMLPYLANSPRR
jgi:hypothetical protein